MAATIKGINVVIGAETTGLSKALSDVNKRSRDITSELKKVERALKFNPNDTVLLAQKQKLLGEQVANTREKLDRLKAAQEQVNKQFKEGKISESQYRAFQREIIETESKLKHFESQLKSTKKSLDEIGKSMGEAGKKITSTGKDLSMKVTAPIAGLGAVITKTGMDFEAGMSEVAAISGATGKDLQALENLAKEMGSTTKFSASEAADGLKYMAMAGWDTTQMLDGLPGILSLAAASGEDLGMVSDIVTDAMTAFGMEAKRAGEFADTLAAASANSNTNVNLLGESFKYVAPVAGALGFEAKDTATALGLMANAGIKGSQSGTALRTMMTNLAKPTAEMQKAMDKYSISLTHTDGSMKSLDEVMLNLRESLGGLAEAEQAAAAATIFGKEAMSGALAIVNTSEADFNKLSGAINNSAGAADRMAKEMQDNLKGRLVELKSAIEGVALQLYEAMQPALEKIVATIQKLVDWFAKLSPGMQTVIIAIAALAAAIGPLLIVFGLMAQGMGAVIGIVGALSAVLPALGAAFTVLTGPIGLVVAAIAALTAIWIAWGDDIKHITSEVVASVTGWFTGFAESITALWNDIKDTTVAIWTAIKDFLEPFWTALLEFVTAIFKAIEWNILQITSNIEHIILTIWTAIKNFLEPLWEMLRLVAEIIFYAILLIVKTVTETIHSVIVTIWNAIKNFLEPFWTALKDFALMIFNLMLQGIEFITTAIQTVIVTIWNTIKNFLEPFWMALLEFATTVFYAIKDAISAAFTAAEQAIQEIWTRIKEWIAETWEAIKKIFTDSFKELWDIGWDMFASMWGGMKEIWEDISTWVSDKVEWITNQLRKWRDAIKEMATGGGGGKSSKPSNYSSSSSPYSATGFAKGGIVTRPTLAWIGEAGDSEAVIPLPKLQPMLAMALSDAMGKLGGGVGGIDYDRLGAAVAKHVKPSITQHNTFNSPEPLSPSETARLNQRVSRTLAMEWGL